MRDLAEPDVASETYVLEIEYLIKRGELATAFERLDDFWNAASMATAPGTCHWPDPECAMISDDV